MTPIVIPKKVHQFIVENYVFIRDFVEFTEEMKQEVPPHLSVKEDLAKSLNEFVCEYEVY